MVGKSLYDLRQNIDDYGLIPEFRKVWKTGIGRMYPTKVYIDENFSNIYSKIGCKDLRDKAYADLPLIDVHLII